MSRKALFIVLLAVYVALIVPFSTYMKNRPVAVKLGYLPEAEALKGVAGDQRYLLAECAVVRVLFYFGTLVEKIQHKIPLQPEYFNMFKTLETSIKLDPYNMDAYYFMQAAFTWELGRARDVNRVLEYGMRHRTWDYQLPFYAGFNAAYFLHDFKSAAAYMKRAAELSGDPLYTTLAARYFYESGRSDLGTLFLETMEKGAKDRKVKAVYELRRKALQAVTLLSDAVARYKKEKGEKPASLDALVAAGILANIPQDPYGGRFYLSEDGRIRSTSKFAMRQ